ncbi:probable proteasome inhibitor [Malania oleifera]|uniref:probable proteasome inhibitor n=1 Tax=Malania oleifera TaxID=397392 RepID=UPI0025AE688A|nr:probable proteasome inhibitor [Malania oleifera]
MKADEKTVMTLIRASRPSFRNDHDKIAFAVHATFLASGYVLTATGTPAFSNSALSSTSSDEVGIDHWNQQDGEYAFVYTNPEKDSKKVLLKCIVMNNKLLVDALCEGGSEPVHLEINVEDYVGENNGPNYATQFKNLDKLVKSLQKEIFSKMHNFSTGRPSDKPSSSRTREESRHNPVEPGVGLTEPQGPQIYPSRVVYPPVYPLGSSDLLPGPGAGMYPIRGDFGRGGGMLLGPNDPSWFGGIGGGPTLPGPPIIPPGVRFDPYGPPGVPGFEPQRYTRNPQRPARGTHPDLEHFGSGSDYI